MIQPKSEPAGAAATQLGTEVWAVRPNTAWSGHVGSACLCRALRPKLRSTKKNEFTRSLQWARPTGQPVITVLVIRARRAAGTVAQSPGSQRGPPALLSGGGGGGLIESRWEVLELSFERREEEEGDGEEGILGWKQHPDEDLEAWNNNGMLMRPWWWSLSNARHCPRASHR